MRWLQSREGQTAAFLSWSLGTHYGGDEESILKADTAVNVVLESRCVLVGGTVYDEILRSWSRIELC